MPEMPLTIDDKRKVTENYVFEEDSELLHEEEQDEFNDIINNPEYKPRILMTTSIRPHKRTFEFMKQIKEVFPNCEYYPRVNYTIPEIITYAQNDGFTHLMIWRENKSKIYQVVMILLNTGPTVIFKVSSITD